MPELPHPEEPEELVHRWVSWARKTTNVLSTLRIHNDIEFIVILNMDSQCCSSHGLANVGDLVLLF